MRAILMAGGSGTRLRQLSTYLQFTKAYGAYPQSTDHRARH